MLDANASSGSSTAAPLANQKKSAMMIIYIKEAYSTCLLIFCSIIVMTMMFQNNTTVSANLGGWASFFIFWISLYWLGMVEGEQASLLGLFPINPNLYKNSHPISYMIMEIIQKGDMTLDRYLMGRQFMVLVLVFAANLCAYPADAHRSILGMPAAVNQIFVETGLAVFFVTVVIGKISALLNASRCMLDYVNTYFAYLTLQVARAVEFSGILHCSYLVQRLVTKCADQQPAAGSGAARSSGQQQNNKKNKNKTLRRSSPGHHHHHCFFSPIHTVFFWLRVLLSTAILIFAFVATLVAMYDGQTTMWQVPEWTAVLLFFLLLTIVGLLEGMQIAIFAVVDEMAQRKHGNDNNNGEDQQEQQVHDQNSPWAKKTVDVLFANNESNIPSFMLGRQMCVTLCFFLIARITTVQLKEGDPNLLGVSDATQALFETGLLGALITTVVASIAWQFMASAFPVAFLSTPVTYGLLQFCLGLEYTGLCQGAWVMARIRRKLGKLKRDEVYIGTAEVRMQHQDHLVKPSASLPDATHGQAKEGEEEEEIIQGETGHLYPGRVTLPLPPELSTGLIRTISDINELQHDLEERKEEIQNQLTRLQEEKKAFTKNTKSDLNLVASNEKHRDSDDDLECGEIAITEGG